MLADSFESMMSHPQDQQPIAPLLSLEELHQRYPRTAERFRVSSYWRPFKEHDIARELAEFFEVECKYMLHYDDVIELPKRPNCKPVGVYPKLTIKGHPANFGPEWFKTFEEARVHILDLAAYIFEEEQRIIT